MQAFSKIPPGVSVSDLVVQLYGSLDYSVKFMKDNPFITSITFDISILAGQYVSYDPTISQAIPANLAPAPTIVPTNGVHVVQPGQTVQDILMQTYGSMDYAVKLMRENGIDNIMVQSDSLIGKNIIFDKTLVQNQSIYNHNKNKSIIYATSKSSQIGPQALETASGIDLQDASGNQLDAA
jgi:hypothetical protein